MNPSGEQNSCKEHEKGSRSKEETETLCKNATICVTKDKKASIYRKNFPRSSFFFQVAQVLKLDFYRVALAVVDREKFTKQNHGAEFHWIYKIKNNHESFNLRQLLWPNG